MISSQAAAEKPKPVVHSTSWEGGSFHYPAGDAEVTIVKLVINEGDEPPFHCHPVPTMGYVVKGELEVTTQDGKKKRFKQGDAVVEMMGTVHRGLPIKAPVELVVFYAGAQGVPTTVLPANDPDHEFCKE